MRKFLSILILICLLIPSAALAEELKIVFPSIGKADAALLLAENCAVLIDTGTNADGDTIVSLLRENGVEALDALIISHYDKDHVGGADAVIRAVPIREVYQPDYEKDSKQYTQYLEAMEEAGIEPHTLNQNTSVTIGSMTIGFDVANEDDYGDGEENDFSLVCMIYFGENRFLFAGDAENKRIKELLEEYDLSADVLKVPHHGRLEKRSLQFFEAVSAEYAVITSSEEEMEDEEVLEALTQVGTTTLLTREGLITITSDGVHVRAEQIAD